MKSTNKSSKKYCYILAGRRRHHHIYGAIYWCHSGHSNFDVYMSNRKDFIANLKHGYCSFTPSQSSKLYNYIRKYCGYRSLRVAKMSKVSITTIKKDLKA